MVRRRRLQLLLLLTVAAGCGPGNHAAVTGTVRLNGKPLSTGTVTFHPAEAGPVAYGMIGTDGGYTLQTGTRAGLTTGRYVVTVVATTDTPSPAEELPGKLLTPARYGDVKQSDLRFEVKPGRNQIDLPLKAP